MAIYEERPPAVEAIRWSGSEPSTEEIIKLLDTYLTRVELQQISYPQEGGRKSLLEISSIENGSGISVRAGDWLVLDGVTRKIYCFTDDEFQYRYTFKEN